jgi:hypothetical protein
MAALFAGECAFAQTAAPTTAPSEPAKKDVITQSAPVNGATTAKSVGTTDKTGAADAYMKAQAKKKAAMAKKLAAKGGPPRSSADAAVRPGSLMTDDERAAHRKQLQSFKTFDECQKYEQEYQVKVEARAKEQHKTLRPFNPGACNRYQASGSTPTAGAAAPAAGPAAAKLAGPNKPVTK